VKRTISFARYLAERSFDGTAVMTDSLPLGRTCYRFTAPEWFENIRPFLIEHWVPVTIRIVKPRFRTMEIEYSYTE
jgi:hypothetical protein